MRPSEREYHTRLGWWVMAHDRGGAALIAVAALAVLALDLIYTASRWGGITRAFGRGFVSGFIALVVCGLIAKTLGVGMPIGDDRTHARRRSLENNVALIVVVLLILSATHFVGNQFAALLGNIAALASLFTVLCVPAILRAR